MKKLVISIFVVSMAISLVGVSLVGCSKTSSTSANTTSASTTSSLKEATITIAVDSPLSGPAAGYGFSVYYGATLAADDFNSAGGLTIGDTHYTAVAKVLDNKMDSTASQNDILQFVQSGIHYLFDFQADTSISMAATFAQYKCITFVCGASNDEIHQPDEAWVFRTVNSSAQKDTPTYAWIAKNHPEVHNVISMSTDNPDGPDGNKMNDNAATAAGFKTIDDILFPASATDYTPTLTKVLAEKPDMISITGRVAAGDAALLIKQMRALGYKGLICENAMAPATDMLPVAGAAPLEGVITNNMSITSGAAYVSAVGLALDGRQKARWGTAYGTTWDFYSQAVILLDAMKRAKSVDPVVVRNMLLDTTQTWNFAALEGGTATFGSPGSVALFGAADAPHQISASFILGVIKNGVDTNTGLVTPP